jgi:ATP-binding cassette subfamily F protein 3
VALAILMLSRANLLVLDEPTNHLDVESIEALEDAIEQYEGTVVLVSHDRELLRSLTTRLWLLHERHITEFAGGFAEWEEVSAERAHAARVRATEEEALNRVHERQRVARAGPSPHPAKKDDPGKKQRRAQRALEEAEARVGELEAKVASLTNGLENPALYTRPDGVAEAKRLGEQLEVFKKELETALERWSEASERVEESARGGKGR